MAKKIMAFTLVHKSVPHRYGKAR